MKKVISLALCIVMMFSVFSVCSVAAEKNTWKALSVTATKVVNGKVTYNIYLEPNVYISAATVHVKYDETVLKPELPGTFVDEDGKKYPTLKNDGAFMITDKYGDENYSVPGIYVSGKVYDKKNVISVGYIDLAGYQNSSKRGLFTVTFKVIDSNRPITSVEFSCVEFDGADEEINISKNDNKPKVFKTIKTDTFEKTSITGVTPASKGMEIKWKKAEGTDFYRVYKKNSKGGWTRIGQINAPATSYVDTTARHGVKETYAVRAFNDGRYSEEFDDTITGLYVAPVSKVTTANSGDGVKISWSAVSGANGYRVYKRVTNADGTKTGWMQLVKNTTAKSYTDKNVANNVKYEYIVRAHMNKVWNANSPASAIYHYDAPTVKVASAKGGVKITWNKIAGAQEYLVYRRNNGTSTWTRIKTVKAGTLSFTDSAATSGKKLDYTVKAVSSKGSSNYITKTIDYVATPKLKSLTNGTSGAVLKWDAVKGATSYRVYRKAPGEKSWTNIATVKTNSYTDKTVKSGKKYSYTVKAFKGSVASGYDSTGLSLKYLVMPKLTKISNTTAGINLKWNATAGASSGYKVYRKGPGETSWKLLSTIKTTSYTDKSVKNGKTYTYTVRAVDGKNLSAYNAKGLSLKRVK